MTEGIPSLLERLQQIEANNSDTALWNGKWLAVLTRECRSEIERLNVIIANHGVTQLEKTEIMLTQKERIRELEADNERLKSAGMECATENDQLRIHSANLEAALKERTDELYPDLQSRIRELEAGREDDADFQALMKINNDLGAERDVFKAKTLELAEECEQVAQGCEATSSYDEAKAWRSVVARLRALSQPQKEG